MKILCNGTEVLDFEISSGTCGGGYESYWSRSVKKMYFTQSDTASTYYRIIGFFFNDFGKWLERVNMSGLVNMSDLNEQSFFFKNIAMIIFLFSYIVKEDTKSVGKI